MKAKFACHSHSSTGQHFTPTAQHQGARTEILVPVDFSAASLQAVRHAVAIAEQSGATLTLVHVIVEPLSLRSLDILSRQRLRLASLKQRLNIVMEQTLPANMAANGLVCEGSAAGEIVRIARQRKAALIVMGGYRHAWWARPFHSHTLAHVIEEAGCPVVVSKIQKPQGQADTPFKGKGDDKPAAKPVSAGQRTACPA